VLSASRQRILEEVSDDAVVLDLGGWANPLERADWVIDLMPYETRGMYQRRGWEEATGEPERFSEATWVQRDLCAREPYPFADDEIDFVVCSHTLEDVRDPIWICSEMARIAKAGYVEVPSRLEEQSRGVYGRPYVGWPHHHWIIDIRGGHIDFTFKSHAIHTTPGASFPEGFWDTLTAEEKVQTLWWKGGFSSAEHVLIDEDPHLVEFVSRELARRPALPARRGGGDGRLRRAASRLRRRGGS
jgi:hypothetical protein